MDGDKITLDRETFKALAVDSRVNILKILDERQQTLSDLAETLHMAPSTIKEHLDTLVAAGLIRQEDKGMKWKYYKLTFKGKQVVNPYETKVMIVLTASAVGMMIFAYTLYSKIKGLVLPDFVQNYAPQAMKSAVDNDVAGPAGGEMLRTVGGYGWTNAVGDTVNNSAPMMPPTAGVSEDCHLMADGMNGATNTVVTTVNNVSTTLATEMKQAMDCSLAVTNSACDLKNTVITTVNNVSTTLAVDVKQACDTTGAAASSAWDAVSTTLAEGIRQVPAAAAQTGVLEKAASTVYVEVIFFAVFALLTGLCIGYLMKKKKMI